MRPVTKKLAFAALVFALAGSLNAAAQFIHTPVLSGPAGEDLDIQAARQSMVEQTRLNQIASQALQNAADLTGDTKTDTINRALQVYSYLMEITESGGDIYVREPKDSEPRLLKMI